MVLRIEEALARANAGRQKKIKKTDVARAIWPDKQESTARMNLANLLAGRAQRIEPEAIVAICQILGCTADFLLGIEK